jgi:hypothetical protein
MLACRATSHIAIPREAEAWVLDGWTERLEVAS